MNHTQWIGIVVGSAIALAASSAAAQEPPRRPSAVAGQYDSGPPTLLQGGHYTLGGFGGLEVAYSRMVNRNVALGCGEGAFLIDHAFSAGVYGCGVMNRLDGTRFTGFDDDRLEIGYGGLMLRYHFFSDQVVNVSVGTMIGAGGLWLGHNDDDHQHYWHNDTVTHDTDAFFVAEPQLGVHVNLTRWARIGATGGLRVASGVDTRGIGNRDITGGKVGMQVQFGWF